MEITVKKKSVYGKSFYYPACNTSLALTKLLGKKTLTVKHLNVIKTEMGFNIKLEADTF
jgi:hypothetical protein